MSTEKTKSPWNIKHSIKRPPADQQHSLNRRPFLSHNNSNYDDRSAFGKSLTSMMNSLSLSRTSTRDSSNPSSPVPPLTQFQQDNDLFGARGRPLVKSIIQSKSASQATTTTTDPSESSHSRARSSSPFSFRKFRPSSYYGGKRSSVLDDGSAARSRDQSPAPSTHSVAALAQSDAELSDGESIRPRYTSYSYDSDTDIPLSRTSSRGEETEDDLDDWSDDDLMFDPATQLNTERNAITAPAPQVDGQDASMADVEADPDPLGEGQNVVVPPEPYFPTTLNSAHSRFKRGGSTKKKKSIKHHHEPLELKTSRPSFQRDRCTITTTQGDPQAKLATDGKEQKKRRRYIVASDMSEESRYALEWAIGTVLRDGDELLVVTVNESEGKVDPATGATVDRTAKLRAQQERQALAYILLRQTTSLLQRTRLHVTVQCQGWHAKNARHMLLDIADHYEPQMLIVGSRGLGKLKGILLGSTSHYLIQKCSVPVMVARRRLKRPPRRSAHLSTSRKQHVSLAEAAAIDRVVHRVDEDVKSMRDEIKREDDKRAKEKDMGGHHGTGGAMNMVGGKNLGLSTGGGGMTPAGGLGASAGVGHVGGIGGEGAIEEEDEKSDGSDDDAETEEGDEDHGKKELGVKVAGNH